MHKVFCGTPQPTTGGTGGPGATGTNVGVPTTGGTPGPTKTLGGTGPILGLLSTIITVGGLRRR